MQRDVVFMQYSSAVFFIQQACLNSSTTGLSVHSEFENRIHQLEAILIIASLHDQKTGTAIGHSG